MRLRLHATTLLAFSLALLATACNKKAATAPNFAAAINAYYQAHPVCLWSSPKQFPVQVDPDDAAPYDALVDQGLLTRTTAEKKVIIVSKRENNYDLSSAGGSAWTADPNQPGYGNFCYGHGFVGTIDSTSPVAGSSYQPGATVTVHYHYTISDVPAWANAGETKTAFPEIQSAGSSDPATATLTDTAQGWQVTAISNPPDTANPPDTSNNPITPADGKIVQ